MALKRKVARPKAAKTECVEIVGLPRVQQLTLLMAETLKSSGYKHILAAAPGFDPPDVIRGATADHRPNITAVSNSGRTAYFDVLEPNTTTAQIYSRWQLFHSAAESQGGQFHVVTPTWLDGAPGRAFVATQARRAGVEITRIWEV